MIEILALRHAPTEWNEEKRLQGQTDLPLSGRGRRIASHWIIPEPYRSYRLYCSPLARARETASLLFPNRMPEIEPALIEMHFGQWEGLRLDDLRRIDGEAQKREAMGLDFRAPGGESPREVQQRLWPFLRRLSSHSILIAHKAVIRALYAKAIDWDMLGKPPHRLKDSCARLFRWDAAQEKLTLIDPNIPLLPPDVS